VKICNFLENIIIIIYVENRIIEFRVSNFKSIKEPLCLRLDSLEKNSFLGIYGNNAAGKSNIHTAFCSFINFIKNSDNAYDTDNKIQIYSPFSLDTE
jgi:AAA15 family ATPase/GTPase